MSNLATHTFQVGYGKGAPHNSPVIPISSPWNPEYHQEQFAGRHVLGDTPLAQRLGEWCIQYHWTRTVEDGKPRLDELLEESEVRYITYRCRGAQNVTGKDLPVIARELADGSVVLEFRDRSHGGGVPNTPAYPYGDWHTVTALQILNPLRLTESLQ